MTGTIAFNSAGQKCSALDQHVERRHAAPTSLCMSTINVVAEGCASCFNGRRVRPFKMYYYLSSLDTPVGTAHSSTQSDAPGNGVELTPLPGYG